MMKDYYYYTLTPYQYREYKVRAGDDREKIIKFRFCDTMGLEVEGGLTISDVEKLLEGRVRDQTQVWIFVLSFSRAFIFTSYLVALCPIKKATAHIQP